MKGKVGYLVLALIGLGLAIGLWLRHDRAVRDQAEATDRIQVLSNQWVKVEGERDQQIKVNLLLETNLALRTSELITVSNRLASVSGELARTEAEARAAAKQAQDEVAKRDAKIAELEGQNEDMTKRMADLNTTLTDLEKQISETERKLAASEGDREFLLRELKRLQAEKAELERQLNDLALLREQVRRLKDELSIARTLERIRRGLYGAEQRGTEKLQPGFAPPAGRTGYDLDVEIRQDGGARVVPATNPPVPPPTPK